MILQGATWDDSFGLEIPPEEWKQKRWGVQDIVLRIQDSLDFSAVIQTSIAGIAIGPFSQFNSLQLIARDPLPLRRQSPAVSSFPAHRYSLTPEQPILFPMRGGRRETSGEGSIELTLSGGSSSNAFFTMGNSHWPPNAGAPSYNNPYFQPPTLHLRIAYTADDLPALNLTHRSPQSFVGKAVNTLLDQEQLQGTWAIFGRRRLTAIATMEPGSAFRLGYFGVDAITGAFNSGYAPAWPQTGYITGPALGQAPVVYTFHDDRMINGSGFLQLYAGPAFAEDKIGGDAVVRFVVRD